MGKTDVLIPTGDPRFLEDLLSLNRGDVPFILTDLHAILNVPDVRRNAISQSSSPSCRTNACVSFTPRLLTSLWTGLVPGGILSMLSKFMRNWQVVVF